MVEGAVLHHHHQNVVDLAEIARHNLVTHRHFTDCQRRAGIGHARGPVRGQVARNSRRVARQDKTAG
jgi:hypothetical protein